MFRTAITRSARSLAQATRTQQPFVQRAVASPFQTRISQPAFAVSAVRSYASGSGLGQDEVTGRILDLLKNFDKVGAVPRAGRANRGLMKDGRSMTHQRYTSAQSRSKGSPES